MLIGVRVKSVTHPPYRVADPVYRDAHLRVLQHPRGAPGLLHHGVLAARPDQLHHRGGHVLVIQAAKVTSLFLSDNQH